MHKSHVKPSARLTVGNFKPYEETTGQVTWFADEMVEWKSIFQNLFCTLLAFALCSAVFRSNSTNVLCKGLNKLIEATQSVNELSKQLVEKEKDLAVASQKADAVLAEVTVSAQAAEKVKSKVSYKPTDGHGAGMFLTFNIYYKNTGTNVALFILWALKGCGDSNGFVSFVQSTTKRGFWMSPWSVETR